MTGSITVVGLGNVLVGDDALGPTVVLTLAAGYELDGRVQLLDLGTPGLDLVPHIAGSEALVVVDTVRAAGAPGEVRLYRRSQLLAASPPQRVSGHDPGLKDTLLTLDLHGSGPAEVLLVGVIPAAVEPGIGLSPEVREAVPAAVRAVVEELARLGCPPVARVQPSAPALWWQER